LLPEVLLPEDAVLLPAEAVLFLAEAVLLFELADYFPADFVLFEEEVLLVCYGFYFYFDFPDVVLLLSSCY